MEMEERAGYPDNFHGGLPLKRYRAMLEAWRRLGKSHERTSQQIEGIAEA